MIRRSFNIINLFKLMEKMKKEKSDAQMLMAVAQTLFAKGGDNRAVATRIFRIFAKRGALPEDFLDYALGIGLLKALSVQAKNGFDVFHEASISVLIKSRDWGFLIEKNDWDALAQAQKWDLLIEQEQWSVLAKYKQWNYLAHCEQWNLLVEYKQWNVLVEFKQWALLQKHNRWLDLIAAGRLTYVPYDAMLGYAFMRSFLV